MSSKLICLVGLVALALLMATALAHDSSLRVIGVGTVQVPADTVIIGVSVQNISGNFSLAEEANSNLLNLTEESLIAAGVNKEEIMPDRSKRHIISHRLICNTVNNTTSCKDVTVNAATEQMIIRLKGSDANQTQKVIDAAKSAGARAAIWGYELSDPSKAVDQARKNALDNAKAKAEYYASSYGLKIGKAMEIEESTYPDIEIGPGYRWDTPRRMRHMFWMEPFPRMNRFWADNYIPEGMAEVTAYVSVTYKV
jgi:uncharacterized protein YggE